MIHILLVDDHPSVGNGTKALLEQDLEIKVSYFESAKPALLKIKEQHYDLYLIDLFMPELNGIELLKKIRGLHSEAIVLIYTGFDAHSHFNLFVESSVNGFISKTATAEELINAVRCALKGEVMIPISLFYQLRRVEAKPVEILNSSLENLSFNEREQDILNELKKGTTNREIADQLMLSQRTVEYYLTGIFSKLKVKSRTEALIRAKELGIIPEYIN